MAADDERLAVMRERAAVLNLIELLRDPQMPPDLALELAFAVVDDGER